MPRFASCKKCFSHIVTLVRFWYSKPDKNVLLSSNKIYYFLLTINVVTQVDKYFQNVKW